MYSVSSCCNCHVYVSMSVCIVVYDCNSHGKPRERRQYVCMYVINITPNPGIIDGPVEPLILS
jgi:hypothetical protein